MTLISREQQELCERFNATPMAVLPEQLMGVAHNVRSGLVPMNGLRHTPQGDSCGWYLWAGEELSEADDFFAPLHADHVSTWRREVIPYLALPPGFRFLLAPDHVDVWFDETLL